MKKLVGLLLLVIIFIGCSKDDEKNEEVSFEGFYKLTAVELLHPYDLNNDGMKSTNLLNELSCYDQETLQFNADGTGQANNTSYPDIYHLGDQVYNVECILASKSWQFEFLKNESTISLNLPVFGNITGELYDNKFSFEIPSGFYYTAYNNGVPFTVTFSGSVAHIYTRQ